MNPFSAPQPLYNATIPTAHQFIALAATQGIPGGRLFVNPVGSGVLQLIPESDFVANDVPTNVPIYLLVQFPGFPDYYDVAMCILFLPYFGMQVKGTLA